jgi:hypothetical protein
MLTAPVNNKTKTGESEYNVHIYSWIDRKLTVKYIMIRYNAFSLFH